MIAKIVNSLRENFKSKLNLRSYQEIDCKYSKQFTKELHSLLEKRGNIYHTRYLTDENWRLNGTILTDTLWKEHFNIDDVQLRDCHDLELDPFYFYYYDGVFYSAECPNGVSNLYRIPFIYRCIHMSKPILKEILQLRYPELGEINVINKSYQFPNWKIKVNNLIEIKVEQDTLLIDCLHKSLMIKQDITSYLQFLNYYFLVVNNLDNRTKPWHINCGWCKQVAQQLMHHMNGNGQIMSTLDFCRFNSETGEAYLDMDFIDRDTFWSTSFVASDFFPKEFLSHVVIGYHVFYYCEGKFYDVECPTGITNLFELPFIQRQLYMTPLAMMQVFSEKTHGNFINLSKLRFKLDMSKDTYEIRTSDNAISITVSCDEMLKLCRYITHRYILGGYYENQSRIC